MNLVRESYRVSVHTVDCKCKEEGYCKSCHAVPRWPSDILLWQRTDITDLSWFRRLREEQRSFSYGLNKIKDRKVIAALETTRGKGAAGEAGGHPGGKSGQPAAELAKTQASNCRRETLPVSSEGDSQRADPDKAPV